MDRNHDITAKTLKKSISLTDSDVQIFLEGEENQIKYRKNQKLCIKWLW